MGANLLILKYQLGFLDMLVDLFIFWKRRSTGFMLHSRNLWAGNDITTKLREFVVESLKSLMLIWCQLPSAKQPNKYCSLYVFKHKVDFLTLNILNKIIFSSVFYWFNKLQTVYYNVFALISYRDPSSLIFCFWSTLISNQPLRHSVMPKMYPCPFPDLYFTTKSKRSRKKNSLNFTTWFLLWNTKVKKLVQNCIKASPHIFTEGWLQVLLDLFY